jgi:peptide deformylase
MALRNIVTEGDDVLRKRAREVAEINDRIREITEDMVQTMRAESGLGLAAPQVGILRRIIVVEVDGQLYQLINPEIVETQGEQFEEEGCLSVPGLVGRVRRPQYIRIKGLSPQGEPVEYEGEGLLAVAFCHECDHLDGILYTDKAEGIHSASEEDEETPE